MCVSDECASMQAERDGWEVEREGMVSEACVLREQLQHLHSELEKLPSDRRRCSEVHVQNNCQPSLLLHMHVM